MAEYSKTYARINWENEPSKKTALSATNLNKMDLALNTVDDRLIELNTIKAEQSTVNNLVKEIIFEQEMGIFKIIKQDGSETTYDTKLEKIAINFEYDSLNQKLIITLEDGTKQEVDMKSLVSEYEFFDTETIGFIKQEDGSISANIKEGSVTEEKLQPNYLAEIKQEVNNSLQHAQIAKENSGLAERWAVGRADVPESATDNSKYFAEQAKKFAEQAENIAGIGIATEEKVGIVKPDGDTITVDEDGTIHGATKVDIATPDKVGVVKPNNDFTIGEDGTLGINLTIGGRNLALNTSNTYMDISYTPDAENANTFLNKVLNDGFNVGDTMLIRLIVKYTDIVSTDGKQAKVKISGTGDISGWNTGYLEGSKSHNLEGSGEIEILHKITIKEEHLKNSYWDLRIVYWSIKSGSIQVKNIKVENGTKSTGWTPATEDLEYPTFDDSGTAEGINSFTDFMAKVKSKMNIFEFFKNFKVGMKFILHTGMIVDNYATKEKGFLPDATLVTSLKEQLDEQNNNINSIIEVIRVDILNYIKTNFISMKSRTIRGFECSNAPVEGGNDFIYYIDTINDINFTSVIAIDVRTNCVYRNNMIGGNWIGWDKFILNSDLPIIESHVVNPNGSDNIEIILNNYTITEKFIVSMTSYNVDVGIIGATATSGGKGISVRLTKNYTGDLRINIMYYKVK